MLCVPHFSIYIELQIHAHKKHVCHALVVVKFPCNFFVCAFLNENNTIRKVNGTMFPLEVLSCMCVPHFCICIAT